MQTRLHASAGVSFVTSGNAVVKPRRAMSVAQNMHAFLAEVF